MTVKFSEDIVPLTDLKTNPGRVVKRVADSRRPVLLTSRGRGVAVVQSVAEFEAAEDARAFMRAVVEGLTDLEEGRDFSLREAKARLGFVVRLSRRHLASRRRRGAEPNQVGIRDPGSTNPDPTVASACPIRPAERTSAGIAGLHRVAEELARNMHR